MSWSLGGLCTQSAYKKGNHPPRGQIDSIFRRTLRPTSRNVQYQRTLFRGEQNAHRCVVDRAGIEPATFGLGCRCSNRLSYLSFGDCSPSLSFQQSVFDRNSFQRIIRPRVSATCRPCMSVPSRSGSTAGKRSDPYPSPDKVIRLCGGGTAPIRSSLFRFPFYFVCSVSRAAHRHCLRRRCRPRRLPRGTSCRPSSAPPQS